jgi:hypothetical protein
MSLPCTTLLPGTLLRLAQTLNKESFLLGQAPGHQQGVSCPWVVVQPLPEAALPRSSCPVQLPYWLFSTLALYWVPLCCLSPVTGTCDQLDCSHSSSSSSTATPLHQTPQIFILV